MLDIGIAVSLALVSLLTAYLGVHVTLHPAESNRAKRGYKIGFWSCALIACALIGWQSRRNNSAQSELREELGRIEKNTKEPPKVEVNVPPSKVTVESNPDKNAPKLSGVIDIMMVGDIPHRDAGELFLLIGVRNQGTAPSIAQGWTLILSSSAGNVTGHPSLIPDDFKLSDEKGNVVLQIPTESHIEDKAITPIPQGAYVRGWLRFIIPNVTAKQIKEARKSLIFYDINDTVCHTDFSHATDKEPPLYFPGVGK